MAKIRLSAIASDMKGKANGSVFASNRGGLYMRNNPKASVKQTAKFGNAKRSLGWVSQQYKNLSDEEMKAWEDMVSSYPTTNAFGEVRIPSGYELFMRLNGVLNANGFPLISVPALPRTQLSLGEVFVEYPDLVQFNPTHAFNMVPKRNPTIAQYAEVDSDLLSIAPWDGYTVAFKFQPNPDFQIGDTINLPFNAFCGPCDPMDNGFEYDYVGAEFWEYHYTNNDPAGPGFLSGSGNGSAPNAKKPFQVFMRYSGGTSPVVEIFVDGAKIITTKITGTIDKDTKFDKVFRFGDKTENKPTKATFSDIRSYTVALDDDQMRLVQKGYLLGIEQGGYGLTSVRDNSFETAFVKNPQLNLLISSEVPQIVQIEPVSWNYIPDFTFVSDGALLEGSFIEIWATPPKSNGANGNTTRKKSLGLFLLEDNGTIPLADVYESVFGNVPANTQVDFFYSLVDSVTGWKSELQAKAQKKPRRFKSAADLTGSVRHG